MGSAKQWPDNPPKLQYIMRAMELEEIPAFVEALGAYIREVGEGKSRRAVLAAVNRYLEGRTGEMAKYDQRISELAARCGFTVPSGWSKHSYTLEWLEKRMRPNQAFPLSFSHPEDRFGEALRMLFAKGKDRAVFKITRPSFDVEMGVTTELAYVSAETGFRGNRILFDYYFTSIEDTGSGREQPNGIVVVPIDAEDIHCGQGAIRRFGEGHLWVGHNEADGDGLIARGRVFYFGPKKARAPDSHSHAGLVLSQRKSSRNDPRCVTCIAQRRDDIPYRNPGRGRKKDVRQHTSLSVMPREISDSVIASVIDAPSSEDRSILWQVLQGKTSTAFGLLEVDSNLKGLAPRPKDP